MLLRAFPTPAEADLVERLQAGETARISLVAADSAHGPVGHILFTPVRVGATRERFAAMGLGPMAVVPDRQRCGIGSRLVEAGLLACREEGVGAVVVLGHPAYYPRFGFAPAWDFGLHYGTPGPEPAFMALELEPGALRGRAGEVVYDDAFGDLPG